MVSGLVVFYTLCLGIFFFLLCEQKPQTLSDESLKQVSLEGTKQPLGIYQLPPFEALSYRLIIRASNTESSQGLPVFAFSVHSMKSLG